MPQISLTLKQEEIDKMNEELAFEKEKNSRATFSSLGATFMMQGLNERRRQREKSSKKKTQSEA